MDKIIRAIGVRSYGNPSNLASELDRNLISLQKNGWKIISITSTPFKDYCYPDTYDSTLFTIIVEREKSNDWVWGD